MQLTRVRAYVRACVSRAQRELSIRRELPAWVLPGFTHATRIMAYNVDLVCIRSARQITKRGDSFSNATHRERNYHERHRVRRKRCLGVVMTDNDSFGAAVMIESVD